MGEGALTRVNGVSVPAYKIWADIIRRCYSLEENRPKHNVYRDCIVSESWKNYSNFYKWYNDNLYPCKDRLEVDKDLLSNEQKIYSEKTCLLIPHEINRFCVMSKVKGTTRNGIKKWRSRISHIELGIFDKKEDAENAYLLEKNRMFKELIDKYRNELPTNVYNKLINIKLVD